MLSDYRSIVATRYIPKLAAIAFSCAHASGSKKSVKSYSCSRLLPRAVRLPPAKLGRSFFERSTPVGTTLEGRDQDAEPSKYVSSRHPLSRNQQEGARRSRTDAGRSGKSEDDAERTLGTVVMPRELSPTPTQEICHAKRTTSHMTTHQRNNSRPSASRANRLTSGSARQRPGVNAKARYVRYVAMARAAAQAGDVVEAENCYQHAEHYFRLMRAPPDMEEPPE